MARWVRWLLAWLGLTQLATGAWAIVAPSSWFARFPGVGPALVAGEPPYNRHLAVDAGNGFLAVGAVLLVAAVAGRVGPCRLAALAFVVFAAPHVAYHLIHPAPGLSDAGNGAASALLATGLGAALAVLAGLRPRMADPSP